MFKNKIFNNAAWIIAGNVIKSILAMIIGMLSARYLGPANYGVINYAASILQFVVPIADLGISNILVQELVNHPEEEGSIVGTSIILSVITSVFCIFGVASFSMVANAGETVTIVVCVLYSLVLIFQSLNLVQYWFQAKYLSKYASIIMVVSYIGVCIYKIFILITSKSVYWFAVSRMVETMFFVIPMLFAYKFKGGKAFRFNGETAIRLVSKGKYYILSSLMINIYSLTDRIMIKLMLDDTATGYYSAATTSATITFFVFLAIIDSFRPAIFENHKIDKELFEKSISKLSCIIIYFSLVQCVGFMIFSKLIIYILYGAEYLPAASVLKLIIWYTTFSHLGVIRNIWVLAEGQQKYMLPINFFSAVVNIVLNYFFIPKWGIMGAAVASLTTHVFANIIVNQFIKPIKHVNTLIGRGLNPKFIIDMVNEFKG